MPLEQLGPARTIETERTPEQIQKDIDVQIRNGVPERASVLKAELEGVRMPDEQHPVPEGITLHLIREEAFSDDDPRAALTPTHIRFLKEVAQNEANRDVDYEYEVRSSDTIRQKQAELAVKLTGRYKVGDSGEFTAIGAGDTLYGRGATVDQNGNVIGDPEAVRAYLNSLGFRELALGYEHNAEDDPLAEIMPDVTRTQLNSPTS